MGKFIFVVGGAKSGKSVFAQEMASSLSPRLTYIATAEAGDKEMKQRIARHRASRGKKWETIEEPLDVAGALSSVEGNRCVVIDCLTLLISNWLTSAKPRRLVLCEDEIRKKLLKLIRQIKTTRSTVIVVSNEVGAGIIPSNKLARHFCNIQGEANQLFSKEADEVFLLTAGIPIKIKGKCSQFPVHG